MRRRRGTSYALLLLLAAGLGTALVQWPRLNSVETGRTPEYPDLRTREYAAPEARVAQAVRDAVGALPGFSLVGGGSGRGGSEILAEARPALAPLRSQVIVRVRRQGPRTTVSVLARSPALPIDFGQNARHVRALLAELDRRIPPP